MNKISIILLFLSLYLGFFNKTKAQSNYVYSQEIQSVVDDVKIDTMWAKLTYLQTQQRFTYSAGSLSTANYLKAYMKTLGFDSVYFQNYTIPGHTTVSPNIIGIKFGEVNPDSIFIACGHWDAYADMAPGADDNGSGTVSVLEAARVLLKQNYSKTLKFCLFSGEEEGLWGSYRYVSASTGDKIGAALNLDMISYQEPGHNLRIGVFPKQGTTTLYNKVNAIQQLYVPGIEIGKELGCSYSCTDVYSFWDAGYDGLFFFESSSLGSLETPYYHTSNDLINLSANSQPKLEKTTKIVVASLATWADLRPVSVTENHNLIQWMSNYPNPFTQKTTVSFQLTSKSNITLKITDTAGKVIATLLDNESKSPGIYEIPFDASLLATGLYFYNLTSDYGSVTQKMMLIK